MPVMLMDHNLESFLKISKKKTNIRGKKWEKDADKLCMLNKSLLKRQFHK